MPFVSFSLFGLIVALIICLIPFLFLYALIRLVVGGGKSREGLAWTPEKAQMVQELHGNLERMEKRIEALEVLLMDKIVEEGKDDNNERTRL